MKQREVIFNFENIPHIPSEICGSAKVSEGITHLGYSEIINYLLSYCIIIKVP